MITSGKAEEREYQAMEEPYSFDIHFCIWGIDEQRTP